jgi:site-specific DNA-methyltransferase (adenine-specific)
MLSKKIKYIYDFIDSKDCFESVDIAGGICYFLIENNYDGPTEIVTNFKSDISKSKRHLDEFNNIFIRFNFGVSIVRKVVDKNLKSMQEIIEPALPFGLISSDRPNKKANYGDYILISSGGKGPVRKERVTSGFDLINKWKLMTSYASHDHGGQFDKNGQRRVLSRVEIMKPGEVCTQSYQILGTFENKQGAEKLEKYVKTKFVRFLIAMVSFSQHINNKKFRFVPLVDLNKDWDDKKLYEFFQLNKDEISSIEKTITEF